MGTAPPYSLEDRTFEFAKNCRLLLKTLPHSIATIEDGKQLVRSSGSVAANYIEANESISKKDKVYRLKVSRKEIKESELWLRLLAESNKEKQSEMQLLIKESIEIRKILSVIIMKF